jgi:hypothetical protein
MSIPIAPVLSAVHAVHGALKVPVIAVAHVHLRVRVLIDVDFGFQGKAQATPADGAQAA